MTELMNHAVQTPLAPAAIDTPPYAPIAEAVASARDAAKTYGTGDAAVHALADRIVFLADGRIVDEMHAPISDRVLDRMKRFGS